MSDKLNLGHAADLLAELTRNSRIKGDTQGIIRAGAKGEFPVYWFNDLKISTWISNFKHNLPRTETCGPVQLTRISLRELAAAESTGVMDFELSDQDFDLVGKMKGRAVDDEGNLFVFRHPATTDGLVTITRDQLFIHESDMRAYAATLPKPAAGVGQGLSTPETLTGAVAVPKQRAQELSILKLLKQQGHNPLALPNRPKGAQGVKPKIAGLALKLKPVIFTTNSFEKAWQRLRSQMEIIGGK